MSTHADDEIGRHKHPIKCIEKIIVHQDRFAHVRCDRVEFPDGRAGTYNVVVGGAAAVLPVRDDEVGLVLQYRYPVEDWRWEIPRGGLGGDEQADLAAAALRELNEEMRVARADVLELHDLGGFDIDSGIQRATAGLYAAVLAPDCSWGVPSGDEIADARFVPVREVERMIDSGVIVDSFTILAFFKALRRGIVR